MAHAQERQFGGTRLSHHAAEFSRVLKSRQALIGRPPNLLKKSDDAYEKQAHF